MSNGGIISGALSLAGFSFAGFNFSGLSVGSFALGADVLLATVTIMFLAKLLLESVGKVGDRPSFAWVESWLVQMPKRSLHNQVIRRRV